jgi:hypothetical protein
VGNPHQIRFRQSAVELFPELAYESLTRRMNGEWAIELATRSLTQIRTAPHTLVNHVVFLRRQKDGPSRIVSYSEADAMAWCDQTICYGEPQLRQEQRSSLRKLFAGGVFELHYSDLDSAVARLETLARTGS